MSDRTKLDEFLNRLSDEIGVRGATDEERVRFTRRKSGHKSTTGTQPTATLPQNN